MQQNKNLIRKQNLTILKKFLFKKKSALKAEMAKETGLSVVTVNSLVKELVAESTFYEGELIQQPLGRPAITYYFNYNKCYFLLLSIQERSVETERNLVIKGKIVNLDGQVKFEQDIDFKEVAIDFFLNFISSFLKLEYNIEKIGISFPGKIYQGTVLSSWEKLFDNWNIEKAIAEITTVPVLIQNDANLLTVGYTILNKIQSSETIVGIFYPENSMPGISIYFKNNLLEGGNNLAGEAKFLPHLIGSRPASTEKVLLLSLIEIISIYNVVIAPTSFVIAAGSINKVHFFNEISNSTIISKQINKPKFLFVENFQKTLTMGLRWLVMKNSTYNI